VSKGYDPKIVSAWFTICPLELVVTETSDTGFSVIVNSPPGLAMSVLPQSESQKPYYVDINDEIYSRLQLPYSRGYSIRLTICSDISDVELLRHEPIVVKPFRDNLMIVAATKMWSISRGSKHSEMVPHDPFIMPAGIEHIIRILSEPIPDHAEDIFYFKRRLSNVKDILSWYGRHILGNSVREDLQMYTGRVEDLILQCYQKERALKRLPEWNGVFINELLKQLAGHVNAELLEDAKRKATAAADELCLDVTISESAKASSNVVDFLSFSRLFDDSPGSVTLKSVLKVIDKHDIPLHQCGKCGADARYIKGTRPDNAGRQVDIWHVACTSCNHLLKRDKWHASRFFVGFLWNKENSGDYPITQAPGFGFDGLGFPDIRQSLKEFNHAFKPFADSVRAYCKGQAAVDSSVVEQKLMGAEAWASYIAHIIKQANIQSNGHASMRRSEVRD
jgi:hypothetical protein